MVPLQIPGGPELLVIALIVGLLLLPAVAIVAVMYVVSALNGDDDDSEFGGSGSDGRSTDGVEDGGSTE
ncbi:hypothetical protein [Haloferax sp. DFSO52]|uniref:hypothetical protein n=1 Tax=Haloferax sp. DFSO52 TaxID=3388505 RepID=UPI003A84F7E6